MSTEGSPTAGIAGRYASALFDLALEESGLEAVETDLATLKAAIDGSTDLQRALKSPLVSRDALGAAMAAILEKAGVGTLTRNFVGLLARNRRLFALRDVITAFTAMLADHRGEVRAEARAAVALDEDQIRRLRTEIEAAVGKAVKLETRVDPDLLGGLVVKVGSRMIDSSLRTKLNRLRTAMKEA